MPRRGCTPRKPCCIWWPPTTNASTSSAAPSARSLHEALQRQHITTAAALGQATGLTAATANKTLAHLVRIGIVDELTARQRGRVFAYRDYVALLNSELGDAPPATPARRPRGRQSKN